MNAQGTHLTPAAIATCGCFFIESISIIYYICVCVDDSGVIPLPEITYLYGRRRLETAQIGAPT